MVLKMYLPLMVMLAMTWTAPGDDGHEGLATVYDMRVAADSMDLILDWENCLQMEGLPAPDSAGTVQEYELPSLPTGTYYVAIKTADEVPNWSDISNIAVAEIATSSVEETDPVEDQPVEVRKRRGVFGCR